tara:strand:+ start:83 stop:349 length:267 start_codon:yes stop_codon:yes gene_type:complete
LLGKLGGVTNVLMILFGFLLFSISEHSFVLKAAKKFFMARTRDNHLFKKDPRNIINTKGYTKKAQKELEIHRAIKLYKKDKICLFVSN